MTTVRALVLFLVLVGVVAGSVIPPVQGQTAIAPVQIGQRVTLSYGERTIDCTIAETRGAFVRCDSGKPDPFSRFPAYVTWYNLALVEHVSIREAQR
ncbi:MAG TPA: hypothetical protein VH740_13905 [Vicinamibacterales bacterium]|jgi:hypothetical protein